MADALTTIHDALPFIPTAPVEAPGFATTAQGQSREAAADALGDIFRQGGGLDTLTRDANRSRQSLDPSRNWALDAGLKNDQAVLAGAGQQAVNRTAPVGLDPAMLERARQMLAARRAATAAAGGDLRALRATAQGGGPSAAAIQQAMALSDAHRAAMTQAGSGRGGNMVAAANGAGLPQSFAALQQGGAARANELSQARANLDRGAFANTQQGFGVDNDVTGLARLQNNAALGNMNLAGRDAALGSDIYKAGADTSGRALSDMLAQGNVFSSAKEAQITSEEQARQALAQYYDNLYGALGQLPVGLAGSAAADAESAARVSGAIKGGATSGVGTLIAAL